MAVIYAARNVFGDSWLLGFDGQAESGGGDWWLVAVAHADIRKHFPLRIVDLDGGEEAVGQLTTGEESRESRR